MQAERSSVGAASRWGAHPPGLEPVALHHRLSLREAGGIGSPFSKKKTYIEFTRCITESTCALVLLDVHTYALLNN